MRDVAPAPMLRTYAVRSSIASMSRKSTRSVVTGSFVQVVPPSVVRSTVAPAPLAHATRSLTALTPRRFAVTPEVCGVHCRATMATSATTLAPNCPIASLPHCLISLTLGNGAPLHHELHLVQRRDVFGGIAVHCDEICEEPLGHAADLGVHFERLGIDRGRGFECVDRRHPIRDHQLDLARVVAVREHADVRATRDRDTGGERGLEALALAGDAGGF